MVGLLAGAGALLGGIAGAGGSQQEQTTRRHLAPESDLERQSGQVTSDALTQLQQLVGAGAGQQDVANGAASQRQLAELLKQLMGTGGIPSQDDTNAANTYAGQAFQGQQNSLMNAFQDQRIQASRSQARMGRGAIDPVLQNKLAQEQTRQQGQLAADQGSFAAQYAQQLPQQRLGFAQQYAGVQSGLATQAMSNRQTLLGLGQQLRSGEQNFRAGTATSVTSQQQPGGFSGFLTGALGGAGAGLSAANAFSGLGLAGGAAGAAKGMAGGSYGNFGGIA